MGHSQYVTLYQPSSHVVRTDSDAFIGTTVTNLKKTCDSNKKRRHHSNLHNTVNPRSNGVADRANRSVVERVRALLTSSKLDHSFCAQAALHAGRTLNIAPKHILNNKSPFELLPETKPDLSLFRIFGCRAFLPVPDAQRLKLDEK